MVHRRSHIVSCTYEEYVKLPATFVHTRRTVGVTALGIYQATTHVRRSIYKAHDVPLALIIVIYHSYKSRPT
jgi:hypothetical protein